MLSGENLLFPKELFAENSLRSEEESMSLSMCSIIEAVSKQGMTKPLTPFSMISRGPVSQSKLISGSLEAFASRSTMGSPSNREVITKKDAFAR